MPVYNDWDAADALCASLDRQLAGRRERFEVLVVDDGSSSEPARPWPSHPLRTIRSLSILHLMRNVGHQRAIAIALAHVHDSAAVDAVLIMDADGEDRPEDAVRLLDGWIETGRERVVFARRRKRPEGIVFRVGYLLYRITHRIVTGFAVQVGNFSVVPAKFIPNLVVSPELWAHYAATVYSTRLPVHLVPADRGRRFAGRSRMNYVQLVTHGLAALSVFRHRVGARLLIGVAGLCVALTAVLAVAAMWGRAEWGLTPAVAALALLLIVLVGITGSGMAFAMCAERQDLGFLPSRDYRHYVRALQRMNEPRTVPVSRR